MHFARVENLYWLVALLPLGLVYWQFLKWRRDVRQRLGHQQLIDAMMNGQSHIRESLRAVAFFAAFVFLGIAAAQPQWGLADRPVQHSTADIVIALDVSESMLAQDALPNRLDAARNEIRTILSRLKGDRVGLVLFTSLSFAQSPLTSDYAAIEFFLKRVHPEQIPIGGTSLGSAIRDSLELLLGRKLDVSDGSGSNNSNFRRANNQVVLLITDGEDHEAAAVDAAHLARGYGIRVLTVGIGSVEGATIPIYDQRGNLTGHKRDKQGNVVQSRLNEEILRELAAITNGGYIPYAGRNSISQQVLDYLQALEREEMELMARNQYVNRQMIFLIPGFVLLLLAQVIGGRPGMLKFLKNSLFTVPLLRRIKNHTIILALIPTLIASVGCDPTFQKPIMGVEQANQYIENGEWQEAIAMYEALSDELSEFPEWHFNIGRAYLGEADYEKAQVSFARTLETEDITLYGNALYNLGLTLVATEKWDDAHRTFRQALEHMLNNHEHFSDTLISHTQENLELAFHELFPPCETLQGDQPENFSPENATLIEGEGLEEMVLCGGSEHWLMIPMRPQSNLSVEVEFRPAREDLSLGRHMLLRPDELQVKLYDSSARNLLAQDDGFSRPTSYLQDDKVSKRSQHDTHSRQIEQFFVESQMLNDDAPVLFVQIEAAAGLELQYDVQVDIVQPCEVMNPYHQMIDNPERALPLQPGNHPMHICPDDEAWFSIEVDAGDSLFVDLLPHPDPQREQPPTLNLEVFHAESRALVTSARLEAPYVTAGLQNLLDSGRYLLRVSGVDNDQQGPYELDVYVNAPCPDGDDRYAPNHTVSSATELTEGPLYRYLRICDDKPDYFRVPLNEGGNQQLALSIVDETLSPNEIGEELVSAPELVSLETWQFDLVDPEDGATLGSSVLIDDTSHGPEDTLAMHHQLVLQDYPEEQAVVRVSGKSGFYHLYVAPDGDGDGDESEQQEQQNDDSQDEQSQDQERSDEQSEDEQDEQTSDSHEDYEDDESESEQESGEDSEDAEDQEEQAQPDEQQNEDASEEDVSPAQEDESHDDETAENESLGEQELARDEDLERIESILRAIEDSDDNFQLQRAIRNLPKRYIERNW